MDLDLVAFALEGAGAIWGVSTHRVSTASAVLWVRNLEVTVNQRQSGGKEQRPLWPDCSPGLTPEGLEILSF